MLTFSTRLPFGVNRLALACLFACLPVAAMAAEAPPTAPTATELQQLRQQLDDMRQYYETRLQALEQKMAQKMPQTPATDPVDAAVVVAPEPTVAAARAGANGFNPAISLVLSGNYVHLSKDPSTWQIPGFTSLGEEAGPGSRGLQLGESEVTFAANVDANWYGSMTLALTPENEAELEEAYAQSSTLLDGTSLKVGRFFSGVGYLNEQHAHAWDFVDAPLAYQAFLGGQLGQDGLQFTWLAPFDQYLLLGAEAGQGASGGHKPGTLAMYARVAGEWGVGHSWRVGLSHLWQDSDRSWEDASLGTTNTFAGKGRTWALDGVWKWQPQGSRGPGFKLQGEYFQRSERGEVVADTAGAATSGISKGDQSGGYVQGIYQWAPQWRVGLRHDRLDSGAVDYGASGLTHVAANPYRNSLLLDWLPSEFSRWRLQLNQDKVRPGSSDTQIYLQYQMNLGAHGAHSY